MCFSLLQYSPILLLFGLDEDRTISEQQHCRARNKDEKIFAPWLVVMKVIDLQTDLITAGVIRLCSLFTPGSGRMEKGMVSN